MEPKTVNQVPSYELPQPQEVGNTNVAETKIGHTPESVPSTQNVSSPIANTKPINQTATTNDPVQTSVAPIPFDNNLIADDADLIEKEWVIKAKQIVDHTKDDPYKQNIEMTKVKANYLKKRYNKDLKLNDS